MQGQGGPSCILMDVVQAPVMALSQQTRRSILHECKIGKRSSNQHLFITIVEATGGVSVIVALDASKEDNECWPLAILRMFMMVNLEMFS